MEGGKDEEKIMTPLFPRLHVNDTEKGGPRAPPRNKMALYEQLSIPSQRFNSGSGSTLLLPPQNAGTLIPSASLSQGGGHERTVFSPLYLSSPATAHSVEMLHSCSSDGVNLKTTVADFEPKSMNNPHYRTLNANAECGSFRLHDLSNSKNTCGKKLGDEDHLRVPTFSHSGFTPCSIKDHPNIDRECSSPFSSNHPGCSAATPRNTLQKAAASTLSSSMQLQNACDRHLQRTNTTDLRSRQHVRSHSQENSKVSITSKDHAGKTVSLALTREKIAEPLKQGYGSRSQEYRGIPKDSLRIGHRKPSEYCQDEMHGSVQVGDVDINDDASETSIVDSILGLDISPDDVVGVIGQKHFWKARKAIVYQQSLFAVQVFELHRLIKVQRLISGSPHLLLEDKPYLIKPSLKASPAKKLPSMNVLNSPPQIIKQKDDLQKPNPSTRCAAENAVGSSPLPSFSDCVNNQSSYGPCCGNPPPAPIAADNKAGRFFHPPPGNQFLVPIMSPSEGLVYKPYPPTAGFMTPIYGSCGPLNVPPVAGDFLNPAYGIPASHPQGIGGVLHRASPLAHTYFPPYGMPVMNQGTASSAVEQVSPLTGSRSLGQAEQLSTGEVNFNLHSQNSCNMSKQKGASCVLKFQTSKESELQGSTASSPCEKAQGGGAGNVSEGRDPLTRLPMAPVVQGQDRHTETHNTSQQHARVIKVVPHNPRSASESAARIFQSIQEERQQYDSV